ncbi:hypothetical protein PR202_gb11036 [Eleusine coracana subsp. coracana]|uniref:Uncharacterized protein n=1 Tax=Eleusine coracana subsp. coracana TaxID=191504 RepID=A0AAV5ELI5_ELECO|nr:hypothetical protein PR202_gb11036 [Eleusine coracana subsp. coracana]
MEGWNTGTNREQLVWQPTQDPDREAAPPCGHAHLPQTRFQTPTRRDQAGGVSGHRRRPSSHVRRHHVSRRTASVKPLSPLLSAPGISLAPALLFPTPPPHLPPMMLSRPRSSSSPSSPRHRDLRTHHRHGPLSLPRPGAVPCRRDAARRR